MINNGYIVLSGYIVLRIMLRSHDYCRNTSGGPNFFCNLASFMFYFHKYVLFSFILKNSVEDRCQHYWRLAYTGRRQMYWRLGPCHECGRGDGRRRCANVARGTHQDPWHRPWRHVFWRLPPLYGPTYPVPFYPKELLFTALPTRPHRRGTPRRLLVAPPPASRSSPFARRVANPT